MANLPGIVVEDYKSPGGWSGPGQHDQRSRAYCDLLERGQILFFREPPFELSAVDREFLLRQEWAEMRLHKNISYRPGEDLLKGVKGNAETVSQVHEIMRRYSANVIGFLKQFLAPYAGKWILDFASFRPFEEERRGLPLHKRNDLLHVDAFPSRPTRGGRILRVFTNLNPTTPRVWNTCDDFSAIARAHAENAGLRRIAEQDGFLQRTMQNLGHAIGIRGMGRTPYDMFMLRFHDYLKENVEFQERAPKSRLDFPPLSTWLVYTDGVAHAAMSGRYALEQTLLVPADVLVSPDYAPFRVLESIAGCPLVY
ncbi:MAG TPA: Kdo hydroxylase family protein [Candidatus Acidoferrales bacterium]|nr:Kdo hydroxylase family protein [Candidatus Acidoferrales bacterium]